MSLHPDSDANGPCALDQRTEKVVRESASAPQPAAALVLARRQPQVSNLRVWVEQMLEEISTIYYLRDLDSQEVRYIGVTTQPLMNRLYKHRSHPRGALRELFDSGARIGIEPLITVPYEQRLELEKVAIQAALDEGWQILNANPRADVPCPEPECDFISGPGENSLAVHIGHKHRKAAA